MLTRFAKILTVIIAFASIGLMGAAITITNAGPNWRTEAEELPDYTFTQDAATKMWAVSHRTDSGTNLVSNVRIREPLSPPTGMPRLRTKRNWTSSSLRSSRFRLRLRRLNRFERSINEALRHETSN